MNISMTSTDVLLTICSIAGLLTLLIVSLRIYLHRSSEISTSSDLISHRTKYAHLDVLRRRGMFLRLGVATALAFAVAAMSWTKYEIQHDYVIPIYEQHEVEVLPPPTRQELPPPPAPPAPPEIEEVEDIIDEPEQDLIDMSIEDDALINEPVPEPKASVEIKPTPPPLPPQPVDEDITEIRVIAEEMPYFPGCEDLRMSKEERRQCSDRALLTYLMKNLRYPSIAQENNVEGRVYVQFVVERDGTITGSKIVRDIGAGCGEAALTVVNKMNTLPERWTPGRQNGKNVRVQYTLPVTFKLQ